MTTSNPHDKSQQRFSKPQLVRLCLALMFMFSVALIFLSGAWAKRNNYALVADIGSVADMSRSHPTDAGTRRSFTQNQTSSPTPEQSSRMNSLPSDDSPQVTSAPSTSQGTQVYVNFDVLPSGAPVPSGTTIYNQYAPAVFTTDPYHYLFANSQYYYGSSRPNVLDRGPILDPTSGFAPLYVDFTTPVNDLKFYVVAVDEYRQGIAQVNVYQNYQTQPTGTIRVDGYGVFNIPQINVGATYNNVTRIEIVNQTDYRGLVFDDFSFTTSSPASPTPTPTPSASPTPFPPINLIATADVETIQLNWSDTPSNATRYTVKRRTSGGGSWTVIAPNVPPQTFTILGVLTVRGVYQDHDVNPDTIYEYAVDAVNSNSNSVESAIASAKLIPSCGDYVRPRPLPQWYPDPGHGWSLNANVSDRDWS